MKLNEIEDGIENHKIKSPETYNDVVSLTIPFHMLYQTIMSEITTIQHDNYQINNSELDVLASLILSGGDEYTLSPTKLYERLLFTSGAITKVLKKLEEKKYIVRIDNTHDKRSKLVQVTPLGKKICQDALKEVLMYEEKCFSALDTKEKDIFKGLLIKIMKNL
jgi:DNA-binding MarR family transcriptional regulator